MPLCGFNQEMLEGLDGSAAREIISLWNEFNNGSTIEAKFVRDIDVAERLLQAHRYHKAGNFSKPLEGFWDDKAMGTIKDEGIKAMVRKIINPGQ